MSKKSLKKMIKEWQKITDMQNEAGDHVRCSKCKEQLAFCDCPNELAREILEQMVERNVDIIDPTDTRNHKIKVRLKRRFYE